MGGDEPWSGLRPAHFQDPIWGEFMKHFFVGKGFTIVSKIFHILSHGDEINGYTKPSCAQWFQTLLGHSIGTRDFMTLVVCLFICFLLAVEKATFYIMP
jgi:hypothetical protein